MSSPILESFGQPAPGAEDAVSAAYWAGVQDAEARADRGVDASSPRAAMTTAFLICEGAREGGVQSSAAGVAVEGEVIAGRRRRRGDREPRAGIGSKASASQPSRAGSARSELSTPWSGSCHGSALTCEAESGPSHEVGRVR